MSTGKLHTVAVLAALLVAVPLVAAQAQPISVLVDGQPLITSAPPVEVGGRILVGMRSIFERLGATVLWDAESQQITAARGARTVVLWIGQPYATVDGAMLPLDVPPQLIGGSTYVPVRFPSEALGAGVTWMSATRTVLITTASMPALDDTTEPPPPPPPTEPTEATGIFRQVVASTPPAVILAPYDGTAVAMYTIAPTAVFQRGEAESAALHIITLTDILPGDDVTLTLGDDGQATRGEARYKPVTITYQAAAANSLLAQDGNVYRLSSDVTIERVDKGDIPLSDLRAGEELALRTNPTDGLVWAVTAPKTDEPPPPPPPDETPQILLLAPEDYTRPLQVGEKLKVRLEGTPGGRAVWDCGSTLTNRPMVEDPPGVYRGEYNVKANEQLIDQVIRGRLTVKGKQADEAEAEVRVSIDTLPPTVTTFLPASDATVPTDQPTITVTLDDSDGTGVDPASVRLRVDGRNVTRFAIITETSVTYQAQALKVLPEHAVIVKGADLAGNEFEVAWKFKVADGIQGSAISSMTHIPPGVVLGKDDILTVTLRATPGGRAASFDIQGIIKDKKMTRQGGARSVVWSGFYKVKAGNNVANAVITGHFVDAAGQAHTFIDQQPVTINAGVKTKLTITQPADNGKVGNKFTLAGTGIPSQNVTYTVAYTGRSKLLNAQTTGQVATGKVKVAADGTWTVEIDASRVTRNPLLRRVEKYDIACSIKGRTGAVVGEVNITVTPN